MDDHGGVLDNRVDICDNLCLIIDQESETVSTVSSSQMSLNNSSNSSNIPPEPNANGRIYVRNQSHRSQASSERDVERGPPRRYDSLDVFKHCHQQFVPPEDKIAQRQLMLAATMCLCFLVGEFVGGYFAHSLAIMTDAAHLLSDFASFLISIFAVWLARRPATKKLSFGYYRAEVLGALVSIIIIWVLTGILVYLAIERIIKKKYNIDSTIMLITSGIGVLFNVAMGVALTTDKCHIKHGHSHGGGGHGHGHSHGTNNIQQQNQNHSHAQVDYINDQDENENELSPRNRRISLSVYTQDEAVGVNKTKNINVRAAFIHVLGDFIQSIGVFIAALIIKFVPSWEIADPICTFLFSILVLFTTITVLRDAVHVLMEGTPRDVDYNQVLLDLHTIPGVKAAHSLHMWSLTLDKAALAVHLAIMPGFDALTIMQKASRLMRFKYSLTYTTIQVEPWDESTMTNCFHCLGPQS